MALFRKRKNINNQTQAGSGGGAVATVQSNLDAHVQDTNNPHNTTKAQVGLSNVDNTSDVDKPVSVAQNNAIVDVQNNVAAQLSSHASNTNNPHSTTKSQVGLSNVDNTADTNKPVSTAQASAINAAKTTLATPLRYLSISGTIITQNLIDLVNHITGVLKPANGGTGINNGNNTLTVPANITALGRIGTTAPFHIPYYSNVNEVQNDSNFTRQNNCVYITSSASVSRCLALTLGTGATSVEAQLGQMLLRNQGGILYIESISNNQNILFTAPILQVKSVVTVGAVTLSQAQFNINAGTSVLPNMYLAPQPTLALTGINGALWNDATRKALIQQQALGNTVLSGFLQGPNGDSNIITNTTVPTAFTSSGYNYNFPANSLIAGKRIRIKYFGQYTSVVGGNLSLFATIGGVTFVATQITTNNAGTSGFNGELSIRINSTTALVAGMKNSFQENLPTAARTFVTPVTAVVPINTAIANNIALNATWSVANVSNAIVLKDLTFEILN
jgi:hypothetical protein